MWNSLPDYVVMSYTIDTFKNRLNAHWKQRFFYFVIEQPIPEPTNRRLEIRIYVESIFGPYLSMLSIRKLMSVVKDVDLEAMPSSIFVNDDDDDDDDD